MPGSTRRSSSANTRTIRHAPQPAALRLLGRPSWRTCLRWTTPTEDVAS